MAAPPPPFSILQSSARLPVLLSVPHAGRGYSTALLGAARLGRSALAVLEDPLVDRLIMRAVEAGAGAVVAHAPRAEIDLNRSLDDLDRGMVVPAEAGGSMSRRASAGLGLIPARLATHGAIWRGPLPRHEVERRIAQVYEPYHAALEAGLRRIRDAFGVAVLLDCHSMPPRPRTAPSIVLGDRFGTSSSEAVVEAAEAACARNGFSCARNDPYAGGEIAARYGRPAGGVQALQIEIDRALYLGPDLRSPGPGFARVAALIASVGAAVGDAVLPLTLAAE